MLESAAMPKTTRVSVTIDRALLDEFKQLTEGQVKLSALFAEAVQNEVDRLGMIALLDELEREDPISPESREAGERLWQKISSSWIPERYRSSPSATEPSGERSAKPQQTA